jgi:hypothetical protein
MKTSLLTIIIFFSFLSLGLAQKEYKAKVVMLDKKVIKGLFYHVD